MKNYGKKRFFALAASMTSAPLGFIVTEDVPNNRWQSYCASGQRRADKKSREGAEAGGCTNVGDD